ncbi:MAG: Holliday junction branch migration protein RuvA [Bacteroidales bacterium]|nr:MAG: Holliday junction branch migration protein RuvA [Bacteroidales bacterium]
MFEFIEGEISEKNPAYATIYISGISYFVNISLTTYGQIQNLNSGRLYIHHIIREDSHVLYGFYTKLEREIFRMLISVSGIGANTARVMLSSMSPVEIQDAIVGGKVDSLKSIKGIGAKSAQRIIVDLRDKMGKGEAEIFEMKDNTIKDEALSALTVLGFSKNAVDKILNKILAEEDDLAVEDLIKKALKRL